MRHDRHSIEYRIFDDKGMKHWVLDRGVVVEKDEHGNPVLVVGTYVDITPTKLLQEKIAFLLKMQNKEMVRTFIR